MNLGERWKPFHKRGRKAVCRNGNDMETILIYGSMKRKRQNSEPRLFFKFVKEKQKRQSLRTLPFNTHFANSIQIRPCLCLELNHPLANRIASGPCLNQGRCHFGIHGFDKSIPPVLGMNRAKIVSNLLCLHIIPEDTLQALHPGLFRCSLLNCISLLGTIPNGDEGRDDRSG